MTNQETGAKTIFYQYLEARPQDPGKFLREQCGDNTELRQQVERLIHCHEDSGTFVEPVDHWQDHAL